MVRGREPSPDAADKTDAPLGKIADANAYDPGYPRGAGLARPVRRRCDVWLLGRQPPTGLGKNASVFATYLGRQCRGGKPAVNPGHPLRRRTLHRHRAASRGNRWRIGEAQPRDGAMNGMERAAAPTKACVPTKMLKYLISQVLQACTTIDQQNLSRDRAHPLIGACGAIAPLFKFAEDALLSGFDGLLPEHTPGERETVEAAEAVECIKAAEEIAISDNIRTNGLIHPTRPRPGEGMVVFADQPHPSIFRPAPERGSLFRAPAQHQPDRVLG